MSSEKKLELFNIFKSYGANAPTMNHYDLAEETGIEPELWKEFLSETDVQDWIASELSIIQKAELASMVQDISESNSVGKAQLMKSLESINTETNKKEGPIFIYCYVPPNDDQRQAENFIELDHDPFLREE